MHHSKVVEHDDISVPPEIAAVRRAISDLQKIYRAPGAADRCHLVVEAGGHRFYADDAWPVMLRELGMAR